MRIAVVGATGEVGRMMIKVLEEHKVQPDELRLFASARTAGMSLLFGGKSYTVEELTHDVLREGFDYVLFSAGSDVAKEYAPTAAEAGSVVIDNSSAFRRDATIPLIVPEINGDILEGYRGIVANPNCSTIQMVLGLYEIHRRFGIKSIVVSTYQSVSGAGKKGMNELQSQIEGHIHPQKFVRQIHLNVIPHIGTILDNGFSDEEMKMVHETHKILRDDSISIWPTTVRVPVLYGHSEAIWIEIRDAASLEDLRGAIESSEDVVLTDSVISPLEGAGTDFVYVSRLRAFDDRRFLMWNVADNIRVGAATNAVRILKKHRALNARNI